jgi:hypothetical protein
MLTNGESSGAKIPTIVIHGPAWSARTKGVDMAESVYKFIKLVGVSPESREKAAAAAVEKASETLRDLRIAEVTELDMQIEDGKVTNYRAKVKLSFKVEKVE